jgi:CDP-diacylglycerol--serine O-phosphatidyltransferase
VVKEPARGIYLLPNLLTTIALFAGFYAIIQTVKGRFDTAAMAIFIGMIADSLDGRVARMTNTQTAFGAEYDSLSDMVCFGVAPALLGFNWGLFSFGNIGWFAAFIYVGGTALRLARFNTQIGVVDKEYFQGLPSPAAAAIVTGFVWVVVDNQWHSSEILISVFSVLIIFCGLLMVSRIRYHSFKNVRWQGKVPFVSLLLIVLIFGFISLEPPEVIFICALLFGISGPIMTLWRLRKRRLERKHHDKLTKSVKLMDKKTK